MLRRLYCIVLPRITGYVLVNEIPSLANPLILNPSYIISTTEVSVVVVINRRRSVHSPARSTSYRIHDHSMATGWTKGRKDDQHGTEWQDLFKDTHLLITKTTVWLLINPWLSSLIGDRGADKNRLVVLGLRHCLYIDRDPQVGRVFARRLDTIKYYLIVSGTIMF